MTKILTDVDKQLKAEQFRFKDRKRKMLSKEFLEREKGKNKTLGEYGVEIGIVPKFRENNFCKVMGCTSMAMHHGYCVMHYHYLLEDEQDIKNEYTYR